jgi:hypothetical protein
MFIRSIRVIAIAIAVGVCVHSVSVRCDIMTCNAYNRGYCADSHKSSDWGTSGLFTIRYRYRAYNVAAIQPPDGE